MGAAAEGPTSPTRQRVGAVVAIVGVGALLPAAVTWLGGGFGITRNDDYAFHATMAVFAEHGVFRLRGPADMTLIGQLILAWPVAKATSSSIVALQLATLAAGTVGLFAVAALARRVLDLKRSVVVALAVAVTPLWAPLAVSFMTDVWALALAAVAAVLAVRATESRSTAGFGVGLAAALVAGSGAFLVRQTAVAILVAIVAGTLVGLVVARGDRPNRTAERVLAAGLVAVAAVACIVAYRWRTTMALGGAGTDPMTLDRLTLPLQNADRALISFALLMLPVSVVFVRRELVVRRVRARPMVAVVAGALIGSVVLVKVITGPIDLLTLYDYASRNGPTAFSAPAVRIPIVPWWPWAAVVVLSAANLWALIVVVTGSGLRRCWHERPVVLTVAGTMVVATAGLFALAWIASSRTFDRYLLPVVPFAALVVAWIATVDGPAATAGHPGLDQDLDLRRDPVPLVLGPWRAAALVVLVAFASWFGLASASFDRAVHRAGDAALARTGADPTDLDSGMTFDGTRAADALALSDPYVPSSGTRCWQVRQTDDRAKVAGPVLEHQQLLWVDRWFYLTQDPPGCADALEPGG